MRHVIHSLLLLALTGSAAIAGSKPGVTAQALLSRISREGGHKVLWDLWQHDAAFDQMLTGIESGNAQWLKIASALRPFGDGSASLSLDYAVANALPKAPNAVLSMVGHGFEVENICTSPFIEPEPGVAEAYEKRTLAALARVKSPVLSPIAEECAKGVRLPDGP